MQNTSGWVDVGGRLKRGNVATVHAGADSQGGAGPRDGPKVRS